MKHANRSSTLLNLFAVLLITILQITANAQQTKQEIRIKPLTKSEIRAIRQGLLTGQAPQMPDLTRDNGNGSEAQCQVPTFFAMNRQGYVTVPEDYANPTGRQIKVFYYGRVQAGKDPVVFFNGGPGSDSHSSSQIIENYYQQAPEIQQVSFIYIDQRGTGCSDAFPTDPTPETVERLTHYTSENIVRDAEVIRETLFGARSQWKVFGQSFGGLITHRYAMVAPQSMKAGFAHGFSLMRDQTEWLTLRIKSQKRVLEVYFKQFPSDRQRLEKLRQLISENLCFKDGDTEICGPKVLDALTIFLGFSTNWSYMDLTIKSLLKSDGTLNSSALTDFVRNYVFGVYNDSGLAGSVISMVEISNGDSDQDSCKKVDAKIEAEGDHPNDWLLNECRLLAGMTNDKWTELLKDVHVQALMTPEMMKSALEKNPNLPFFLYSGQKDVFVPVETFQEETSLLGNLITYRSYPDSGHEGFYTERQVWKDIVSVH